MENISQMSLLEVAVKLMEDKRTVQNIYSLIKEVLEMKGLTDEDGSLAAQLYVDITTSSKFVYMDNDEWDLKSRQSLEQFEKDGASFNTGCEEVYETEDEDEDEYDDLDEDDLNEDDLDEDEDDDEDKDDEYDDLDDDDEYDDLDEEDLDDSDKYDEDFEEDKYNEYMDDYEDMYDN